MTKELKAAKRNLKRLEHRIAKLKRKLHRTHGAHRKALTKKLHKLESHKKKVQKRRKAAAKRSHEGVLVKARLLFCVTVVLIAAFSTSAHAAELPHIKHLFVIVEENENAEDTFGAEPPAPYLGKTMARRRRVPARTTSASATRASTTTWR